MRVSCAFQMTGNNNRVYHAKLDHFLKEVRFKIFNRIWKKEDMGKFSLKIYACLHYLISF